LGVNHNIELHIEELLLQGFDPRDREAIGRAVQLELTRLLTEHGMPQALAQGVIVPRLDGGALSLQNTRSEVVGTQVAQSVYGAVGGTLEGGKGGGS
jgi:hypothetical protein